MSWYKTKLDPADVAWSKYIRTKAGWRCARCGREASGRGLHCAHFHSRRKESVRYDEQNTDALCANCHKEFTGNYSEHKKWKLSQLGQSQYDLLELRANTIVKKDRKMEVIRINEMLKELNAT